MLIWRDGTKGGVIPRLTVEDHFHQVVIFHAKLFSQMLTWCLIFCAQDDSAQVKKDPADAHLFLFFPCEGVFLAGGFLPRSALAAGGCPICLFEGGLALVSPLTFAFAGTGSGPASACFTGSASGADTDSGVAICGFSFNSTASFFSSSFQFGIATSRR